MPKPLPLFLASSSPRRRNLLEDLGFSFRVLEPEESDADFSAPPPEVACQRAKEKLLSIIPFVERGVVIGCDTVVALGKKTFGRPRDAKEAASMLAALSGRTHNVVSGLALARIEQGALQATRLGREETKVTLRKLSRREITRYLAEGEYVGKAGAYAIQGKGRVLIERVEGCYTNVVGLPVPLLLRLLDELRG